MSYVFLFNVGKYTTSFRMNIFIIQNKIVLILVSVYLYPCQNLLYLEHYFLFRVFRVPQSVQQVKTSNSHKALGVLEHFYFDSIGLRTIVSLQFFIHSKIVRTIVGTPQNQCKKQHQNTAGELCRCGGKCCLVYSLFIVV